MNKKLFTLSLAGALILVGCNNPTSSGSSNPGSSDSQTSTSQPTTSNPAGDSGAEAFAEKLVALGSVFSLEGTADLSLLTVLGTTTELGTEYIESQLTSTEAHFLMSYSIDETDTMVPGDEYVELESYFFADSETGELTSYTYTLDNEVVTQGLGAQFSSVLYSPFATANAIFVNNCFNLSEGSASIDMSQSNEYRDDIDEFLNQFQSAIFAGYTIGTASGLTFNYDDDGITSFTLTTRGSTSSGTIQYEFNYNVVSTVESEIEVDYEIPQPLVPTQGQTALAGYLDELQTGYTAVVQQVADVESYFSYILAYDPELGLIYIDYTVDENNQLVYTDVYGYIADPATGYIYRVSGINVNNPEEIVRSDEYLTVDGEPVTMETFAPIWNIANTVFFDEAVLTSSDGTQEYQGFISSDYITSIVPLMMSAATGGNTYTVDQAGSPMEYYEDQMMIILNEEGTAIDTIQGASTTYGFLTSISFLETGKPSSFPVNFEDLVPESEATPGTSTEA